ncbi:MAG: FKBP-type peptidyl-prolyl cis-trans isomerase [Hyphomicrobiales bacterium]
MNLNIRFFISVFFISVFFASCNNTQEEKKIDYAKVQNTMMKVNKIMVKNEDSKIDEFITNSKLPYKETGSGLRFYILSPGKGDFIEEENVVTLLCDISSLDSITYYSSKEDGPKTFRVGKGGVASGLEEGVKLLKNGAEASFILPSHLAYGLIGDEKRIPPKEILLYNVKVIDVKQ